MTPKYIKKCLFYILLAPIFLVSVSCADNIENRGYVTKYAEFSKIKAGTSTKQDVFDTLGSPSTISNIGAETWIYAGSEETQETFFTPEVKSYDAYTITFNNEGVVKDISQKTKADQKEVEISEDFTKTSGNEITFLQQMFGNIGKFNPGDKSGASRNPTSVRTH